MPQKTPSNRLLASLPRPCADRLLAASTAVDLPLGTGIFRRDEPPRFLYFLTGGIGSVVFTSEHGTSVELSTEGSEGLLGWSSLLGPALRSSDCTMQVGGAGLRIPFEAVRREFSDSPDTRHRIVEYAQFQFMNVSQVAACNRIHRAEERFVRWILMVADRLGSDDLAMTQEFLSTMLGARRTTVAEVCADLARAGAIEGRRGGLRIVNREALRGRVCECYAILRERLDALYPDRVQQTGSLGTKVSAPNGLS